MFNQELKPFQREALEDYLHVLITAPHNEQALLDALQKLVLGSQTYDFMYLITKQNLTGGKLNEADQKLLKSYQERRLDGWQELTTRQQFLDFDNQVSDKDRVDALKTIIKEALHYTPTVHKKPFHQEHQGAQEGDIQDTTTRKNATLDEAIFNKDLVATAKEALKKAQNTKDNEYQFIQLSIQYIHQLPLYMAHVVDFSIFHPEAVMQFAEAAAQQDQVAGIVNASFLTQVKAAMAYRKKQNDYNTLDLNLCNKMSLEQLKQLKGFSQGWTDANIVGACFSKQYCLELSQENQEIWTNKEKYDNLVALHAASKADKLPKSLSMQLLALLLILGPKIKQYNKEHFKSYCKYQEERNGGGTTMQLIGAALKKAVMESHSNQDWSQFMPHIYQHFQPHIINEQYLYHFGFSSQGDLSEFKNKNNNYLNLHTVNHIEDRVRIYLSTTGLKDLKLNNPVDADTFKAICDEVNLTFLPENKDKFKIEELVELWLEIKNVSTVHIKVFEFNTLTYYRKTMQPFNTSIDLDGLESTIVRQFEYNAPANCKRKEQFLFPELNNRVGLFIIEFVGNGRSARAVVKKGSLSLIHKSTSAGHIATIIDDSRQVCKGSNTGIWVENKFHAANEDGSIFIAYAATERVTNVIMVHGDFAQLGEFRRKSEDYNFDCKFHLNEESVLVGSTCTVFMNPTLKINGRQAGLSLLQNVTATLKTEDFIDCTPTTKVFSGLKVSPDQDLTISFQVPPNLKYIDVRLTCQVMNTTSKSMQDFNASKRFQVQTFEQTTQVFEYHLKMVKDNKYEIHVLGKNGEPQPNKPVRLSLQHTYHGYIDTELTTDLQGKIYLGQLDKILTVRCDGLRHWRLPSLNQDQWTYPQVMDTVKGASVEIPVAQMWDKTKPDVLDRRQVTLTRSKHGIVIEDWFTKIKLVKKQTPSSHYYLLLIEGLQSGEYNLQIRGEKDHQIQIKCHNGEYLKNMDNVILKKNCLQELVASQKIVKVKESSISPTEIKLQLADYSKDVKVHIMATHYVPNNCYSMLNQLQQQMTNQVSSSVFTFAKWSNLLLSDRQLSDEYRYVFDRVHADRALGNSLERPSLLNKRLFTRKTEIDQEILHAGSKFENRKEAVYEMAQEKSMRMSSMQQQYQPRMQNRQMMSQNIMCESVNDYANARGDYSSLAYHGAQYHQREYHVDDYITDYQNFIRDAPLIASNLKPNSNGEVSFKHAKLEQYSTIQVLVVDNNSVMQSVRSIQSETDCQKRDLSLKKSLNENKGLTQSRQHVCLNKGGSDFVEDITSSEIMLVDDLSKVAQILNEIKQITGISNSDDQAWQKLQFTKKWDSLKPDQKNFYFGEYQCNELNFWIKTHDKQYFDDVVRSFLSCKMEKQFVDLYLLDQDDLILKTYKPQLFKIQSMNAFEKCLLIAVFVRQGEADVATRVCQQMRHYVEGQGQKDRVVANRIFDLVLNMNSTSKNTTLISSDLLGGAPSRRQAEHSHSHSRRRNSYEMKESSCEQAELECDELEQFCEDDDFCGDVTGGYLNQQRQKNFDQESFQQLEATKEYMETFYYNTLLKGGRETMYLVPDNKFWLDYAEHIISKKTQFISENFTECITPVQMFLCQTVLDLPWTTSASLHQFQADESRGVTIVAGSSVVIFKKEIKEVEVDIKQDFLVTQRYHRIDSYGVQNKSDDDPAVPTEFLVNVPYECEVIMTNVSPNRTEFNLLYQIPIGAMPIKKTKFMKSQPLTLESYSTERLQFQFYFPQTGKFGHYPSNVSIGEKVQARGQFNTLNVVSRRTISQQDAAELNFDDLVQVGTQDQILDFLKTKNVLSNEKGFDIYKIMWLLQDKSFWLKAVQILAERQIYMASVWEFALQHLDLGYFKEYLQRDSNRGNLSQIRGQFKSSLFERQYNESPSLFTKMLEYNPMINSRAHKVGQDNTRSILNKTFRQTYDKFLKTTAYKTQLSYQDKMIFVYYLQLQDRIPEAIKLFQNIEMPEDYALMDETIGHATSALELQYDYLNAYFDFFTGSEDGYKVARRIVQRYDNYPLSNWKLMFLCIEDQLNDYDGEFDQMTNGDYDSEYTGSEASLRERKQENMKKSKNKEPLLQGATIDDKGVLTIESVNIKVVTVKYYTIDAEILFSRAPFLKDNATEFSYVKPTHQTEVQMCPEEASEEELASFVVRKVDLPSQLVNKNLVIEVNGEGKQEFKTFYSTDLKIQVNEAFGELKVMHGEQALGKVYCKVFAMSTSGVETFYRDGYSDIRGKFEYLVSSGNSDLKAIKKFAILVQSAEYGSVIREVTPPKDEQVPQPTGNNLNNDVPVVQASSYIGQQKQERMINRNNWVNSKKMSK